MGPYPVPTPAVVSHTRPRYELYLSVSNAFNSRHMDIELIKEALESSLNLLNEEFESVVLDELKEEYLAVIQKIETALTSIENNG